MGMLPVPIYPGTEFDSTPSGKSTVGGPLPGVATGKVSAANGSFKGSPGGIHLGNLAVRVVVNVMSDTT